MGMPSIEQIVSRYLFNQDTPPSNLKDENLIRAAKKGDPVYVDMNEYMTTGAGRFAGLERFNLIRNFLGANDEHYDAMQGGKLPPGVYTVDQIYDAYGKGIDERILSVSQYYSGIFDDDFADRAYIFGSTEFRINPDALFYVNEDGSREIVDVCVIPENDNFDYEGAGFLANLTNALTKKKLIRLELAGRFQ